MGQSFEVRTDQQSLKFLLEQKVGNPIQQKCLTKLLDMIFLLCTRKGRRIELQMLSPIEMKGELILHCQ